MLKSIKGTILLYEERIYKINFIELLLRRFNKSLTSSCELDPQWCTLAWWLGWNATPVSIV